MKQHNKCRKNLFELSVIPTVRKRGIMYPIITKLLQEDYEHKTLGSEDKTPDICGYYGRACRQMDKAEGANRMLCTYCELAKHCEKNKCLEDKEI